MITRDVFDDGDHVLRRDHLGQWWKVEQKCVRCGKCCMDVPPTWPWYDKELGGCRHLKEEEDGLYRCVIGGKGKSWRPMRCIPNSPFSNEDYCKIKLVKISNGEAIDILLSE